MDMLKMDSLVVLLRQVNILLFGVLSLFLIEKSCTAQYIYVQLYFEHSQDEILTESHSTVTKY